MAQTLLPHPFVGKMYWGEQFSIISNFTTIIMWLSNLYIMLYLETISYTLKQLKLLIVQMRIAHAHMCTLDLEDAVNFI